MRIIIKPMGAAILLSAFATMTGLVAVSRRAQPAAVALPPPANAAAPAPRGPRLAPGMLRNADFEEPGADGLPSSWKRGDKNDPRLEVTRDPAGARDGDGAALHIGITPGDPGRRVQGRVTSEPLARLPASGRLAVSGWARATGRWDRAQLFLHTLDAAWNTVEYREVADVPRGGEWTRFHRTVPVPPGARSAVLHVVAAGRGADAALWVDGIEVSEVAEE